MGSSPETPRSVIEEVDELESERAPSRRAASSPIRILLADDHAVLRAGTRRILDDEPDLCVIGEASDGQEAIALAASDQPDVIVLDISMPGTDGIAAFGELRRVAPEARLLILTAHDRQAYVRAFRRLGAAGYLLKSAAPRELISAIRRVHLGESVYGLPVVSQKSHSAGVLAELTARELAVIREVARGRTNREIAEALHLGESTIEFHLHNTYGKLNAASRADAVLTAQRLGWLDSSEPLC
jgi:DNA-binding NarL/FixJ family response regulator